jgi:hypothetical protein
MAPKGAEDNHATTHARSDIDHRPNRGHWAGMNNWRGHFSTNGLLNRIAECLRSPTVTSKGMGEHSRKSAYKERKKNWPRDCVEGSPKGGIYVGRGQSSPSMECFTHK